MPSLLTSLGWFLRPTLVIVILFAALVSLAYMAGGKRSDTANDLSQDSTAINPIAMPSPTLEPDGVVRIQLSGLANKDRAKGTYQCMCFASPKNRALTGSVESFVAMVRNEPFDILSNPDSVLVGKPTIIGGDARVLVTAVSGRQLRSFVWLLAQQSESPYEGCWMTEAVFPLQFEGNREEIGTEF